MPTSRAARIVTRLRLVPGHSASNLGAADDRGLLDRDGVDLGTDLASAADGYTRALLGPPLRPSRFFPLSGPVLLGLPCRGRAAAVRVGPNQRMKAKIAAPPISQASATATP